jgi:hypothetical protein
VAPPSGTSTIWTVSSSALQILSTSATSITVKGVGSDSGALITATINNPCGASPVFSKTVTVGKPISHNLGLSRYGNDCEHFEKVSPYLPNQYHYYWSDDGVTYTSGGKTYGAYYPNIYDQEVWLKVTNACGSYIVHKIILVPQQNGVNCQMRLAQKGSRDTLQVCKVFPNPSNDIWHIVLKRDVTNLSLELTDMNGKLVYQQAVRDPNHSDITVSNVGMREGIYFLKVVSNLETAVYKLIKN